MTQIVLVRPWRGSAEAGGGCCSAGASAVRSDDAASAAQPVVPAHQHRDVVAETYRLLRERLPEVDVQMTTSSNTLFLLPTSYAAARRRKLRRLPSLRQAIHSTTAGAVLIDGERAGDIAELGPGGVLGKVLAAAVP